MPLHERDCFSDSTSEDVIASVVREPVIDAHCAPLARFA